MAYDKTVVYTDAVVACADLVGRTGAMGFTLGHVHENVPIEKAGWYAEALYQGARLSTGEHRSPTAAAMDLAERLLRGSACKCGQRVTLSDESRGCRWQLVGKRWQSECSAPPIHVGGARGDRAAAVAAYEQVHGRLPGC